MRALPILLAVGLAACTGVQRYDFDGDGIEDSQDCGPEDPTVFPDAVDPWGDGIDQDCDGGDGVDRDRDGYPANVDVDDPAWDCNDADGAIHPGAPEIEDDNIDQDCDGQDLVCDWDEDFVASIECGGTDCDDFNRYCQTEADCADADEDGFRACDDDCDDGDPDRYPGNLEVCDGLDNDCEEGVPPDELDLDSDGYLACAECDDTDASVNPDGDDELICDGRDTDCDGQVGPHEVDLDGDGDPACSDCEDGDAAQNSHDLDGDGHSSCALDCDDGDASVNPTAFDELGDELDSNCDGIDGVDLDGDGWPQGVDCDDSDDLLNRDDADLDGASTCDGDCDDNDAGQNLLDVDWDGFSTCEGDCQDTVYAVNPSVTEVCDLVDNDCDGVQVDEMDDDGDGDPACNDCDDGVVTLHALDLDGDGYTLCGFETGDPQVDCDDGNFSVHPGAIDLVGDDLDTNCDDLDGYDFDQDGFASLASGGPDCDDTDPTITPTDDDSDGASECHGDCDDADPALNAIDLDGDGADTCAGDCDDADPAISPLLLEACDGEDTDCEPTTDETIDDDGDGFSECEGDCLDADPLTFWGAAEQCDLVDNDCDGTVDEGVDSDGDGDGQYPCQGDCDDLDLNVFDGAPELCDGLDGDCDGVVPADEVDADGDGYRICEADCDDADLWTSPGAAEICDSVDNDCDGLVDDDCVSCDRLVPTDHATIQEALAAWSAGEVICVDPGTWTGTQVLPAGARLVGVAGPGSTVLDGEGLGQVLLIGTAIVEGFTVTGGAGSEGGAAYLSTGSPVLRRLWFIDNSSSYGGAFRAADSWVVVSDSRFIGNEATSGDGGAVHLMDGYPTFERVLFAENSAQGRGGAIHTLAADLTISDSVFRDNLATSTGGAISVSSGDLDADRVEFVRNTAWSSGGAVCLDQCSYSVNWFLMADNSAGGGGGAVELGGCSGGLAHGHLVGNAAGSMGGGIRLASGSATLWAGALSLVDNSGSTGGGIYRMGGSLSIANSNLWDNAPDEVNQPVLGIDGNFSADPLLLDLSHPDPLRWDLHLDPASPLVDAHLGFSDPDLSPADIGIYGGAAAGEWDRDGDGYPSWWQPGPYESATYPVFGWDCDDLDPTVYPGAGC